MCEECRRYFKTEEDVKKHKVVQHETNKTLAKFRCQECDFIAKTIKALEIHNRDSHWKKEFICEKCDFITFSLDEYNGHIEKAHSKVLKSILKNKMVKSNEVSDDMILNDLNTLLNGSKSRRESKLISTVRNLVKINKKQNNEHERRNNEIKKEENE